MLLDLVDVFGSRPLSGNPLAVVRGAEAMDAAQMLKLTQWLGFSETAFLLPATDPEADYRVRIFYPAGELPFAGHPTLGSCHAWLQAGGVPRQTGRIVQECGVGLVEVKQDGERLSFAAPPLTRSGALNPAERAEAIRIAGVSEDAVIEAVHVVNGPRWQLLRLRSAADVLDARPVSRAPVGTDVGLAGPCDEGNEADWELRAFFADQHGALLEDPVTGSFNAGVALHLFETGLEQDGYVAAQGRMTGADGRVTVTRDDDATVWVGGRCDTIAAGAALSA
jgi:PhzF family phenazine biosynthesis protein